MKMLELIIKKYNRDIKRIREFFQNHNKELVIKI